MKPPPSTAAQSAASRPLVLAVIFFVLGAALTGAWFQHQNSQARANDDGLTEPTRNVLGHLAAPVAIRFYSLLPASTASGDLQAFSGRLEKLLAAVQAAGDGKIQVTRFDAAVDTNATAAAADGIQAFNLDQGDACFLGLAISSGARREVMARLQPEWESALPYDLVRAIQRVATPPAPAPLPREIAQPSPEIISSIQRLIPDVNAVTAEAASQIFHAEFMKECATAGTEMETQMAAAQQQVTRLQGSGSAEELAAAEKHLLAVQLEQGEKLKRIAADLQTRLAVFRQLKTGTNRPVK